ncbi:MAG: hypothetical protein RLZZ561_332 [Pseudomonadota bacterium]
MSNFVKEFIEITDHTSLDDVIDALTALRQALPDGAQAEMRLRGDDIFGRKLSICYLRPKQHDELAGERPYLSQNPDSLAA